MCRDKLIWPLRLSAQHRCGGGDSAGEGGSQHRVKYLPHSRTQVGKCSAGGWSQCQEGGRRTGLNICRIVELRWRKASTESSAAYLTQSSQSCGSLDHCMPPEPTWAGLAVRFIGVLLMVVPSVASDYVGFVKHEGCWRPSTMKAGQDLLI